MTLSKSRATTMGGAFYIPMSELLTYAKYLRLDDEEIDRFVLYLQALDEVYLEAVNDTDSKTSKTPQSGKESRNKFINS